MAFCDTDIRPVSQEVLKKSTHKIILKFTLVELLPHRPGAIELSLEVGPHII